jgi:hypothetical protein
MPDTQTYIDEIRELLSDKDNWTTGCFVRDEDGNQLSLDEVISEKAYSWCLWGAALKVIEPQFIGTINRLFTELNYRAALLGYPSLAGANDKGGHDVVMDILDMPDDA